MSDEHSSTGPTSEGRLLVTGQMRSGTTMLSSFLDSQDDIQVIPDGVRIPTAALVAFGPDSDPSAQLDGEEQAKLWTALQHIVSRGTGVREHERAVMEAYASRNNRPEFSSQVELYLRLLDDIAEISPGFRYYGTKATRGESLAQSLGNVGAKAIVILRDPRAVFASQAARAAVDTAFVTVELAKFVVEWRDSYDAWRGSGDSVLSLRFEDFVLGDTEFARISDYLGVEIRPDVEILSINSSFGDSLTGSRRLAPVDRWRDVSDSRANDHIKAELKVEMEAAGYA